MDTALEALLANEPTVLGLGEPSHAVPAFQGERNEIFAALVERGFRSIALETDRVAAIAIDDYVSGRADSYDPDAFSHGWGGLDGNRELVEWMRAYNASHPDPLTFYGMDAVTETVSAPSPRRYLRELCTYVAQERWDDLDELLGDDEPWDEVFDPSASLGGSDRAKTLRASADDLIGALYASAPRLIAATSVRAWHRAHTCGTAAVNLLRYHAQVAIEGPDRLTRMSAVRDAWMAQNMLDIRVIEQHRGPTLLHAHNRHVQRNTSRMRMGAEELEWASAGSILSALLADRYAVVLGSLGASPALRLAAPPAGTYEHALDARRERLISGATAREVTVGLERRGDSPNQMYFPLDADDIASADAFLHVAVAPGEAPDPNETVSELARNIAAGWAGLISRRPDVRQLYVEYDSEAPESNWGNYFFYVGEEQQYQPFATVVIRNMPGFDEESRLDRPDVVRLNLHVGRQEFERLFGAADGFDYSTVDEILPHPVYATQGWVCVLNPERTFAEVDRLIGVAHANAVARRDRRESSHRAE
ncbi:DUF6194 family protein [Cryptosporangium arvum]|uniref:DUF6194 family protein n=1 Tax=Cryptosporangium arvum TaxID=80871 RepID=UPI0004BB729C|nr:DUF6194 family protein [Cryptosporangium arvum]